MASPTLWRKTLLFKNLSSKVVKLFIIVSFYISSYSLKFLIQLIKTSHHWLKHVQIKKLKYNSILWNEFIFPVQN